MCISNDATTHKRTATQKLHTVPIILVEKQRKIEASVNKHNNIYFSKYNPIVHIIIML